jgi:type IV pilus assembly protein PilY1
MNIRHLDISPRLKGVAFGLALGLAAAAPAHAAVDIADAPLFVTTTIEPNIMFLIDDSGSMHFELMPDNLILSSARYVFPRANNIYGPSDYSNYVPTVDNNNPYNALSRSPQVNTLYYNPAVTYTPWSKSDGSLWPNASPSAAYHNPAKTTAGSRNLTVSNTQTPTRWVSCTSTSSCSTTYASKTFWPATYFRHNGGSIWTWGNYTRVEIRSTTASYTGEGRENRSDCAAAASGTCTYDEEIQNFANWYSYYRSRVLSARAGIGKAFSQQSEGMRVGFGAINKGSTTIDGLSTHTIVRGVRTFSGTDRDDFFDMLYERDVPAAGTPLRTALDAAGQYYSRTNDAGPWGAVPGTNDTTAHLQCRQSYTILMTDGYWTEGSSYDADTSGARNNVDNTSGPVNTAPDGTTYQYTASAPYKDGYSNILADVAMYYWNRDLRTDLANEVPTSPQNPAFWQHMVTFGVGLGVTGSVDPDTAWTAVTNGTAISWPNPVGSEPAKLDDLLHASINGHGGFFSAADPETFANELSGVLDAIVARVESSATASAASTAVLQSDTMLYTAGFRSGDWSGMMLAYDILAGGVLGGIAWDAEDKLRTMTPATRKLFTTNSTSGSGTTFSLASLSTDQQNALNRALNGTVDGLGTNRIDWLRGSESAHASFRSRSESGAARLLGDIIHSNPQFAGKRNFGYGLLSDLGASYNTFRNSATYQSRPDVIYTGANDGMLHGFDALTGVERFAYVPGELLLPESGTTYARINHLMDPNYTHRYYMDGTAAVGDAYWGGSWKTVLVGSMGSGGRTVFALDVTNPGTFGASNVLWEFTDPDLGYNVGQPTIVRMHDGEWAAVFGNGYNSDSNRAVLFIVSLSSGQLLAKIDTGVGSAAAPNGLGSPQATDWPVYDLAANVIYAGDLLGNMWRFDVSASSSGGWNSATKLFSAKDPSNAPQPITARPGIAINPNNTDELVVLFGTGAFFRTQDGNSTQIQTLYGIFDDGSGAEVTGSLTQQEITGQSSQDIGASTYTVREISSYAADPGDRGWYLNLNVEAGERVISGPNFPAGISQERVRFSTLVPDDDPCSNGRRGFIMDVSVASGGSSGDAVFDLNQDGYFDSNDGTWSGIGGGHGEELTIIRDGMSELIYGGSSMLGIGKSDRMPSRGRQSWHEEQ